MNAEARPVTLLISAMGGEGGGVLASWILNAATAQGLPAQGTSIPGVAQRTGATTYYIEVYPVAVAALGGRMPAMSIYPGAGDIDLMVASELLEVGRAMERGFVNPERTTLIGATHRSFTMGERTAMGDGRHDGVRILAAAPRMARRAILFDVVKAAAEAGSIANAVLLGAIAGSGVLPMAPRVFEAGIRAEGKAVEANLAGFAKGLAFGRGDIVEAPLVAADAKRAPYRPAAAAALESRVRAEFPIAAHETLLIGVARVVDFQDPAYGRHYLDRVATVLAVDGGDHRLTAETARHLALRMTYEDVIRVAQLKTRPARLARVRAEVGAGPDEPLRVTEFLKPGIDELCSLLPPRLARAVIGWAERRGLRDRLNFPMHVKTHTISGFLRLRTVAGLRRMRRRGHRFQVEQAQIETWLDAVRRAAALDRALALEVVELARLIKGYGGTHRRGAANFARILHDLVAPAIAGQMAPDAAASAVAAARDAALADADGEGLSAALAATAPPGEVRAAQ